MSRRFLCCMCSLHDLLFLIKRKRQPQRQNSRDRAPFELDDIPRGSVDTTTSSISPVYQNMVDIRQQHQGNLRCYLSIHSTFAKAPFLASGFKLRGAKVMKRKVAPHFFAHNNYT